MCERYIVYAGHKRFQLHVATHFLHQVACKVCHENGLKQHQKNVLNESTTGADASVEMPKLHNIKLLYTHINYDEHVLHANSKSG